MSEPVRPPISQYELRAPRSGMGARDPRSAALLWGAGSILIGLAVAYLLIRGEMRLLVLVLLGLLGLASLSPRRGVFILTIFLPFMYFIRRAILSFEEFSQRDPILLFPVITAIAMALGVVIFRGPTLLYYVKRSPLLKCCLLLMLVFTMAMANPLQGNPLVGVAGAIFFIVPMLWVFFGLLTPREDLARLFHVVLAIGCITALYGLKQRYFGFTDFEIYELKSKDFLKTFGTLEEARIISTFAGLTDFARYLTISAFIAFAYFWRKRRDLSMLLLAGLMSYAMLFTASRTSYFVVIFSIVSLIIIQGRDMRKLLFRGAAALVIVVIAYGYFYKQAPRTLYNQRFSSNPFVVHTLSGMTHPTEEGSFQTRLQTWSGIVTSTFREYPLGHGLGTTTQAAGKFEGGRGYEADSYFFELFYGSGVFAPLLFLLICYFLVRYLLALFINWPDEFLYQVCIGFVAGTLLSSFFYVAPRDTITGPLCWLVIGWIAREEVDRRLEAAPAPVPSKILAQGLAR